MHSHAHADHDGSAHSHDHSHGISLDASDATDEDQHKATVAATFDMYRAQALSANQRRRAHFYALPAEHRQLLCDHPALLNDVDQCIEANARFLRAVVDSNVFPPSPEAALSAPAPTEADHEVQLLGQPASQKAEEVMQRLRSTLRQVARDWTASGAKERAGAYDPIVEALLAAHANESDRDNVRVLVPGAGLGRLAFEIWRHGFTCQANEFSMFMLIMSGYIINFSEQEEQWPIHPYVHSLNNMRSKRDVLQPVKVPDVMPQSVSTGSGDFSFAAGDFVEVYSNPSSHSQWDSVCTSFFIDTARNIVEYLQLFWSLLKPGGTWINNGPTLWHFENANDGSSSIELTVEQVKDLARKIGFVIESEKEIKTSYTSNPLSTLRHEYTVSFWVARKPAQD